MKHIQTLSKASLPKPASADLKLLGFSKEDKKGDPMTYTMTL